MLWITIFISQKIMFLILQKEIADDTNIKMK